MNEWNDEDIADYAPRWFVILTRALKVITFYFVVGCIGYTIYWAGAWLWHWYGP